MPAHDHTAHAHAPKKFGLAFAVGAILNFGLVVALMGFMPTQSP